MASLWNNKAKLWVKGREDGLNEISNKFKKGEKTIWVHCSSLGEFEQGRPVLEKLKQAYPEYVMVLTFFSPSGYEVRKDYKGADYVFYLPLDSKKNASTFIDIINPALVIFVKYDLWYYYINECHQRDIPVLLISAIFRKSQVFFKWYGGLHRKMLQMIAGIFAQDTNSAELLIQIGFENSVFVSGDTRFDRVAAIAEKFEPIPIVESFCNKKKILVAGSTWPDDEKLLASFIQKNEDYKLIIAPHEISASRINAVSKLFPDSVLYSSVKDGNIKALTNQVLIIDNIGMLSRLYYYATFSYIGGGFNSGIHNILEAAVFGKPVIFGPKYQKFKEAAELIESGAGVSVSNNEEFEAAFVKVINTAKYEDYCKKALAYVDDRRGATENILQFIQEKRLLTN